MFCPTVCGICGYSPADPTEPVDPALLRRMTEVIAHRGPDGEGLHLANGVGLGVRRLAIVDLQTGDQPLSSADGSIVLVCNGEIYNYLELRDELERTGHRFRSRSDVEVIVHLYEDLGPACLHRLRGMFALALWDAPRRRLLLARDRLGIKPLHYALLPTGLLFGSEQKAILQSSQVQRRLDLLALRDLFLYGFITEPRTLLEPIRRLSPGHLLLYQDGRLELSRYWDPGTLPRSRPGDPSTPEGWAEALREKLDECVRLHLRSDVPVGALLSPGLDSSSVVSLMSRRAADPFPVFSLGFEQPESDELRSSPTLASFPGFNLLPERVTFRNADFARIPEALWFNEDPTAGGTFAAGLCLSEAAARRVKVVLAGEGADELFGGYSWFKLDRWLAALSHLPSALRQAAAGGARLAGHWASARRLLLTPAPLDQRRYWRLVGPPEGEPAGRLLAPELRQQLAGLEPSEEWPELPADFARWHRFDQLQYLELTTRLPSLITRQLDRHSMARGLEVRVPFLDHELVELSARIPASLKLRRGQEKHILRLAMRDLLPPSIAQRPKFGLYAPAPAWLSGPLPDFAAEALAPTTLRRKGYFDPELATALLERHRRGVGRGSPLLMVMLSVHLWDDLFVQGQRPAF